jgi:hypothetical protein
VISSIHTGYSFISCCRESKLKVINTTQQKTDREGTWTSARDAASLLVKLPAMGRDYWDPIDRSIDRWSEYMIANKGERNIFSIGWACALALLLQVEGPCRACRLLEHPGRPARAASIHHAPHLSPSSGLGGLAEGERERKRTWPWTTRGSR